MVYAGITTGFSVDWWQAKHNKHHMFTNSMTKDDDIRHDYKKYL